MPTASLISATSPAGDDAGKLPQISSKIFSTLSIEDTRLIIHRRTTSHHGSTLRTLGHAAEYLAQSRSASIVAMDARAEREAIHILQRLSREIFDDYVAMTQQRHPVTDWIMNQAVRLYGAA
jgi:hypothetical protein